jgi:hypothetical protein
MPAENRFEGTIQRIAEEIRRGDRAVAKAKVPPVTQPDDPMADVFKRLNLDPDRMQRTTAGEQ